MIVFETTVLLLKSYYLTDWVYKFLPAKPVFVFLPRAATSNKTTKRLERAHFGDSRRVVGAYFVSGFTGI